MLPQTDLLLEKIETLQSQVMREREMRSHLESEVTRLNEIVRDLKRAKFGTKSERWESQEQLVFNEAELESTKPDSADSGDGEDSSSYRIEVKAHKKKRGHRKALPADLEREVVKVELPANELLSDEGLPLKIIGYEISEKLSYEPAKAKVIEYHRAKYGVDSGDYVKTAPSVPSIIPQGIATSELLASIVVEKYGYGLPLYRQEYRFDQMGVSLTRQTMARWVVRSAEAVMPVWNILCERLLSSFYVSADETYTQVLKEKGRAAESKSWMWVRCVPTGKNKIVLFDYDPHRSSAVAKRLLQDFKGFLQVDGYAAYNALEENSEVVRLGCNMHGRRYFEKAFKTGAQSGKKLSSVGLQFYKRLYDHEELLRKLSPEERHKRRLDEQSPIWNEFFDWARATSEKVPPKSKIGEAFGYFLGEYKYLTGYLKDGRLEMDNGFAERVIRKFAIGRNNWMFADTEAGANASAMFYSLLCTAKVNNVNIYEAMKYLFDQMPKAKTVEDVERLADVIMGITPIS